MLEIKHLTKYYTKSKPIISDMNLTFPSKGLNIIVGKSGCGKTTLLNMIGTMDQDYIGSIELDGVELSTLSYNKITDYRNYDSAYIFQINSLFEHLTVKQNIELVLDLQDKEAKIDEVLEKVGLKGFENKKVKYLSGGERQRVGIARALVKDCKIILADEPTSALDSKNAHRILSILKEISKEKLVIVVTHDTKKAFQYADRIIKLVDGRVVEDETINHVEGDVKTYEKKQPRKRLLRPIFWDLFRKNLVINLFIIILCSAVLVVFNLAKEQRKIMDDYNQFYNEGNYEFNPLRTLSTHVANEIDFYNVVKAGQTDEPYTYFKKVSDKNGGLSVNDIEKVSNLFKDYNIHYGNALYGGLVIEDVSMSFKYSITIDGMSHYWNENQRTNYLYYTYNENNDYDLIYGRRPQNDNEIMITDTIANEYLLHNDLDNSDLSVILGTDLIIDDIYHVGQSAGNASKSYFYNVPTPFTVVGILRTNQLQYFTYGKNEQSYLLVDKIFQQTRDSSYMNKALIKPYGYVVTMNHLDAYQKVQFYEEDLKLDSIYIGNKKLSQNTVSTFHGYYDYRGLLGYEDNLVIDHDSRIVAKDNQKTELTGNEIIVSRDLLKLAYPDILNREDADIKANYQTQISGKEITLSFYSAKGIIDKTFKIVGVSKTSNNSNKLFYVSNSVFDEIDSFITPENNPSITLELKGVKAKERIKLIEQAFSEGYVLVPQYKMPGPYLEFVPTQGEVELQDEEGYLEKVNISVYYLFSRYYNNDDMNSMNSVLEIINSIYAFCLIMGIVISLGFIYLKEKRQKMNIMKLSQIGVSSGRIVVMNFISYVLVSLLIGGLSYILTSLAIDIINSYFVIDLLGNKVGLIARFRLLLTNTTLITTIISTAITLILGLISSIVIVNRSRR